MFFEVVVEEEVVGDGGEEEVEEFGANEGDYVEGGVLADYVGAGGVEGLEDCWEVGVGGVEEGVVGRVEDYVHSCCWSDSCEGRKGVGAGMVGMGQAGVWENAGIDWL